MKYAACGQRYNQAEESWEQADRREDQERLLNLPNGQSAVAILRHRECSFCTAIWVSAEVPADLPQELLDYARTSAKLADEFAAATTRLRDWGHEPLCPPRKNLPKLR